MNDYDTVILFSGGADSHLILNLAMSIKKRVYCVLIDYNQKHIEELEYATNYLDVLGVPYQIIKISGYDVDSGLTGNGVQGTYKGVSVYNVPARNSIFLTIAAGIAENIGATEIWIGCDMSDYYGEFPDCKQDYIGKMNDVFKIAFSYPISIEAPLLGWTKTMIVDYLDKIYHLKKKDMYVGYREFT